MTPPVAKHRAPTNGRHTALAACAVLAVMLNAGAIGLATQASTRWHGVAALAGESTRSPPMLLVAAPVPEEPAALTAPPTTESPPANPPLAPHQSPPPQPTARTVAIPETAEPPQQVLFYTYREVDTPAFPESDWNLDVGVLDEIGVQRLVFEVLVSDHGQVVGCTVLQPVDLPDEVKRSLEKRLSETSLLPALRAGQLVASVRRIELLVADAPPAASAEPAAHRP